MVATKLTGAALPAADGSAIQYVGDAPTISANDPTTSTNTTLGTIWVNSTSGEVYICTNATTNSNVWTNVGDGSGNIS
jgi:hypothetical protein